MNPAAAERTHTESQWLNSSPTWEGESEFPLKLAGVAKSKEGKLRHKSELLWPSPSSDNEQD